MAICNACTQVHREQMRHVGLVQIASSHPGKNATGTVVFVYPYGCGFCGSGWNLEVALTAPTNRWLLTAEG